MKTSTKILVTYGAMLIGIQALFAANSLVQYYCLKPLAARMCTDLDRVPAHHIEIDISKAQYEPVTWRTHDRDTGPWVIKADGVRDFYFGSNLASSRMSRDTLYIKAMHDDLSWRPSRVSEIHTVTIITADGVISKNLGE